LKTNLRIHQDEVIVKWPNLELDNHHETSVQSKDYNCIAWALVINNDRWAPYKDYAWFPGLKKIRDFTGDDIEAHKEGFRTIGYNECSDGSLEPEFEKIAFYIKEGSVEHIARQLDNGHWTSKLGEDYEDIEHYTLNVLEDGFYGKVQVFMKRKKTGIINRTMNWFSKLLKE
jgi:hypothetical protein